MPSNEADRQARRKAATKAAISKAANQLFESKGFAATSIADISQAADVATRTIYLHFDSKAAILLTYFDDWLTDLTDRLCARPADETLDTMIVAALGEMEQAGWQDNQSADEMERPHPLLESLSTGSPEIAGHVMQSWVRAQGRLAEHFRATGGYDTASLEPRVRAATLFANWMATVLTFQDEFDGAVTTGLSTYEVSVQAIGVVTRGFGE